MLVDRLWPQPRGRERSVAQGRGANYKLRHWFNHDPERLPEFSQALTARSSRKSSRHKVGRHEIRRLEIGRRAVRYKPVTLRLRGKRQRAQQCRGAEGMAVGSRARSSASRKRSPRGVRSALKLRSGTTPGGDLFLSRLGSRARRADSHSLSTTALLCSLSFAANSSVTGLLPAASRRSVSKSSDFVVFLIPCLPTSVLPDSSASSCGSACELGPAAPGSGG